MMTLAVAFGVMIHVLFWGAGLAMLAMPGRWRRFWPVLVAPAGFVLQSLVVWAGAHANLRGTDSYGWASELLPVTLLAVAIGRRGLRNAVADLGRFGLVFAAMAACLGALALSLALAAKGLTTVSLGSCDAADYAAGARVLQEFARTDREGFLGLTEVVRVMSTDNFFDFWLRLNHFTPSALIALNGSIFHCAPHELTSLMTAVLLASSLPVVFLIARGVLRYSSGISLGIAVLYAFSPVVWYAFAHVAMGQLLASQGIAVLTWAGISLWRGRLTIRRALAWSGVLAIGYAVLLGSYNFILLVCLVPALAYAGGLAAWHGDWARFGRWLAAMLAPLLVCGIVMAERVAGLAERFTLLRTYDFGWRIPAFTPEGWLGMVQGPDLRAWAFGGVRWMLTAIVLTALGVAVARAVRQRRRSLWTAACLSLPVLAGYVFLQVRGARLNTNASYDAYKLLAVFYPEVLAALCWWVTLRWSRRLSEWLGVVSLGALVLAANLVGTGMIFYHLANAPLVVDGELRQLRKIERMPEVTSVNLLLPDMWSRLWANAFLLRKAQFFPTHTYEGRLNTPLRGEWNLSSGLISLQLPGVASKQITPHYALVRANAPTSVRADFGRGWHPEERLSNGERWRWSEGDATVQIDNPRDRPLTLVCTLDARSVESREVGLGNAGAMAGAERVRFGAGRTKQQLAPILVPPGRSELTLHSVQPPTMLPGDSRALGLCVYGFAIEVRE